MDPLFVDHAGLRYYRTINTCLILTSDPGNFKAADASYRKCHKSAHERLAKPEAAVHELCVLDAVVAVADRGRWSVLRAIEPSLPALFRLPPKRIR